MTAVQTPWDPDPDPMQPTLPPFALPGLPVPPRKPRGRPAPARSGTGAPPWPYHHLVVTGPAAAVQAFAAAACGPGIVPWAQDGRAVEDWVFDLAASQPPRLRSLDIEGCRVLARQFRDRFERHHSRAATAAAGQARHCPLDLHALWPVPDRVLRLGPADPAALVWMAEHWGVVDGLRQVVERPDLGPGRRLPRGHAWVGYGFFTGEGTAVSAAAMVARLGTRLGAGWPALRFVLRPGPD